MTGQFSPPGLKARCAGRPEAGAASLAEGRPTVKKKKPVDPIRQAEKNRAHRIGWLIALAGIAAGFALVMIKPA